MLIIVMQEESARGNSIVCGLELKKGNCSTVRSFGAGVYRGSVKNRVKRGERTNEQLNSFVLKNASQRFIIIYIIYILYI